MFFGYILPFLKIQIYIIFILCLLYLFILFFGYILLFILNINIYYILSNVFITIRKS